MCHTSVLSVEFFSSLVELDNRICAAVSATRCVWCGGPLHRADYPRKPRGGVWAEDCERFCTTRFSLCCGWPGCRRRTTPPSVRFMGRKVYLGVVVVLACLALNSLAQAGRTARDWLRRFGVPRRTVQRWQAWWRGVFCLGPLWRLIRGCFVVPAGGALLLNSLVAGVEAGTTAKDSSFESMLDKALRLLAPATTGSIAMLECARFMGGI